MSYVREDDKFGRLSEFRERLEDETRTQLGEAFPIFQDRNDILWGENWKSRIEDALDEVTFLIPIITPSFFRSPACRTEMELFIKREKLLGRSDLILPVYYVDSPVVNDEKRREADPLAEVISARQCADWRNWRFEPFSSPEVGRLLANMARQIRDALDRLEMNRKPSTRTPKSQRSQHARAQPAGTKERGKGGSQRSAEPSSQNEPPTHVVDPLHRGDFPNISDAIAAANPGDRILVRPGYYQEGIVLDKPLEIVGDGDLSEIIVHAVDTDALLFQTTMGRVTNLTFRQGGGDNYYAVDITQGRLELEGCDITSASLSCVAIRERADPRLRRNRIHDGRENGVFCYANGRGTLEDNDISGNGASGVEIDTGAAPTLRRNRIHDNRTGVYVHDGGRGLFEDNDILDNAEEGVFIATEGDPIFRRNRINRNSLEGIRVMNTGRGRFENNDLRENGGEAWNIADDAKVNVKMTSNLE